MGAQPSSATPQAATTERQVVVHVNLPPHPSNDPAVDKHTDVDDNKPAVTASPAHVLASRQFVSEGLCDNLIVRLPAAIRLLVSTYLIERGVGRLASTCVALAKDDAMWRPLAFRRHGPRADVSVYSSSWRLLCADNNCRNDPLNLPPIPPDGVIELLFGTLIPSVEVPGIQEDLAHILFEDDEILRQLGKPTFRGVHAEQFAKAVVVFAEATGHSVSLMKSMISYGIELTDKAMHRRDDMSPRAILENLQLYIPTHFMRFRCALWLRKTFGRILHQVGKSPRLKPPQAGEQCTFKHELTAILQSLIDALANGLDGICLDVRRMLKHMHSELCVHFPDQNMGPLALSTANFFLLKCVYSIFLNPEMYLPPLGATGRGNLVFIWDLLRQTASGEMFGLSGMRRGIQLNSIIVPLMPSLRDILLKLVRLCDDVDGANPIKPPQDYIIWAEATIFQTLAVSRLTSGLVVSGDLRCRLERVLSVAGGRDKSHPAQ